MYTSLKGWVAIGQIRFQHAVLLSPNPIGIFRMNSFPTFQDLELEFKEILPAYNVNNCTRATPENADCIVRFYEAPEVENSNGEKFFVYGCKVFVKKGNLEENWIHYGEFLNDELLLNCEKYITDVSLEGNEGVVGVECSYYDTYWRLW